MTLAHKIDGLLTISKIQNLLAKVILGSKVMYRKLNKFEAQFKPLRGKLSNLIALFLHLKVTANVVYSRRTWFHWAACN